MGSVLFVQDFSKIESGQLELDVHLFDVTSCVEEALDLVIIQTRAKKLELNSMVDANIPTPVLGDAGRIRQIIVNLLSSQHTLAHTCTHCKRAPH